MKKIAITLGAVIVLGALTFMVLGTWKTYVNTRYGFSINYPSKWSFGEEKTSSTGQEFYSPNNEVFCYAYGFENIFLNATGETLNFNLDDFIDWLTDGTEIPINVLERNEYKMDKRPAIHLLMEWDDAIKEAVYTLSPETGIGYYCYYDNLEERERFKPTFNRMVSSIKIKTALN